MLFKENFLLCDHCCRVEKCSSKCQYNPDHFFFSFIFYSFFFVFYINVFNYVITFYKHTLLIEFQEQSGYVEKVNKRTAKRSVILDIKSNNYSNKAVKLRIIQSAVRWFSLYFLQSPTLPIPLKTHICSCELPMINDSLKG